MRRTLSIGYSDTDRPPSGGCVVASPAAPVPRSFEPAGAIFHEVALKQAGLYGEFGVVVGGGGWRN